MQDRIFEVSNKQIYCGLPCNGICTLTDPAGQPVCAVFNAPSPDGTVNRFTTPSEMYPCATQGRPPLQIPPEAASLHTR